MRKFLHGFWRVISSPFRLLAWLISLPIKEFKRLRHYLTFEPEERPVSEALAETVKMPSALIEHVEVLRKHLTRMLIGLLICVGVVFIFTPNLVDFLAQPIGGISALKAIDVTESVGVFMRVALLGGLALASPYLAFELWLFAAPGLKPRSRVLGLFSIPLVMIFFIGGIAFAYFILMPPALKFLLDFMGVEVIPRPSSYIGFVTGILFWIGITFEFPLVIYILTLMGLIQPKSLLKHWRIAVIVIAVLAAAITPTTDPVNMALVMGPMVLLYFISIALGYLALAGRRRKAEAAETA
ncbi:MAG: twin-arginine translocase subunit TatC [Chloroflexota bacterium]